MVLSRTILLFYSSNYVQEIKNNTEIFRDIQLSEYEQNCSLVVNNNCQYFLWSVFMGQITD